MFPDVWYSGRGSIPLRLTKRAMQGKEYVWGCINTLYKEAGGCGLSGAKYRYIMKGYANGIKAGMYDGKVVRLKYLGSLQPSLKRLKRGSKKVKENLVVLEKGTYLCKEISDSANSGIQVRFKPISYVSSTSKR